MSLNPSEMNDLMASTESLDRDNKIVDLSKYDFASLAPTIKHESAWVLQLEHMGMVDASGRPIDSSGAHTATGSRLSFMVYCYDDKGTYRAAQDCIGLPTSAVLLQYNTSKLIEIPVDIFN